VRFSKADTVASDAVQTLTQDALVRWYAASTQWPDLGGRFSPEEQSCCAQKIDAQFEQIDHSLAAGTRTPADAQKTLRVLVPCAVKIVEYALGAADEQVLQLLEKGMLEISLELASRARRLDPEVSLIDVLQAARNAWTACALQLFLGREMRLTPAIFAYSMLYPYSDNYLDDVASSPHVKLRFSERFRARLCGERLPATDAREALIWELVGIIEAQYSRERFPAVYDSLLAIHAAQQDSLCQLHNTLGPELDVADLTFTKGGTSVLADAYLAAGELCEAEAKMAFNWGVVLQLGDDLQE
jgi:hypothetical protein